MAVSVLVARIDQSPWPEMTGCPCDDDPGHVALWVIWTQQDTGDGMRFSCTLDLGSWVIAVWDRIDGGNIEIEDW